MDDPLHNLAYLRNARDVVEALPLGSVEPFATAKVLDAIDQLIIERDPKPQPYPDPCPEGFHWLGQGFDTCDACGLPAWEHAGRATMPDADDPWSDRPWHLQPWEPGERAAIARKWAGNLLDRRRRQRHAGDLDRRLCDPAVNQHVTPHRGCVYLPLPT